MRIWQLVSELSEQLAHNQKMAGTLNSQVHSLKVRIEVAAAACWLLKGCLGGSCSYSTGLHTQEV